MAIRYRVNIDRLLLAESSHPKNLQKTLHTTRQQNLVSQIDGFNRHRYRVDDIFKAGC